MSATRIDGKATAQAVRAEVKTGAAELLARSGVAPGLAVVLVGDDPASQVYVRNKDRAAQEAGFEVRTVRLAADTAESAVLAVVGELNADAGVHGILVQLPLPAGIDSGRVVRAIDPRKDVDGLHPDNVAALVTGQAGLRPCTPLGCIELCDRFEIPLEGARVVVIGRSMLVGKPFAMLALERNATVTIAHSRTRELPALCAQADVLVAAVGRPELVRGDWIKPGAAVLDVGINRVEDPAGGKARLLGDVAFDEASERAGAITPVPGGVGPMTIAMLCANTLQAARALTGAQAGQLVNPGRSPR